MIPATLPMSIEEATGLYRRLAAANRAALRYADALARQRRADRATRARVARQTGFTAAARALLEWSDAHAERLERVTAALIVQAAAGPRRVS